MTQKITKTLVSVGGEAFSIIIPGRLSPGFGDKESEDIDDEYEGCITDLQKKFLHGTVLHSLIEPGIQMVLELSFNNEKEDFIIPSLTLRDVEPEAIYSLETKQLIGTKLRVPKIHTCANKVFAALEKGSSPLLENLKLSYIADLRDWIDTSILRSRIAPAVSGLAMGNENLPDDCVCIPRNMAAELLNDLISYFYKQADSAKTEEERQQLLSKALNLANKRKEFGNSIISGLPNMVVKREPATVYGAVKRFKLLVGDWPGMAIYTNSNVIDNAGGKLNGK